MNRIRQSPPQSFRPRMPGRRGFTTPAVAIALLVAMGGLALILDRLWLDAADLELTTAAEAAALAAAGELACDDLLKPAGEPELPESALEAARQSAAWIAGQNLVAGDRVMLDEAPDGDIRFGRLLLDETAGQVRFEETVEHPTTAVVTAMRTRSLNNPVSLFIAGATGQLNADLVSRVEASIDNRVRAVRPCEGTPVPAYPLAIWWRDPSGSRRDTWENQIERRQGPDQFGYDPAGHRVYTGSDGIPEIVLHSQVRDRQEASANVLVVDLGTGLNDQALARQFVSGWTIDDLADVGGEIPLQVDPSQRFRASDELRHGDREALDSLLGEPRICLLYSSATSAGPGANLQATCVRLVAIRVLAVRDQTDGTCEVVVQPCVVTTRTAVLDVTAPYSTDTVRPVSPYAPAPSAAPAVPEPTNPKPAADATASSPGNPFIYKLQLSN